MTEPTPYILHSTRYGARQESEWETLEEAIRHAAWLIDQLEAIPERVTHRGKVLLEEAELSRRALAQELV